MKKPVYYVILALLIGVFLFAAYKVGSYYLEKYRSDKVISDATRFVTLPGEDNSTDNPDSDPGGDPECPTVQFDELKQQNEDVIAWIYGANTHINYPVVQGSDNATICAICWTAPGTTTAASLWIAPTRLISPTRTA